MPKIINIFIVELTNFDHINETMIYTDRLHSTYQLKQLHFHWDRNDSKGSEHRINGQVYPLEVN